METLNQAVVKQASIPGGLSDRKTILERLPNSSSRDFRYFANRDDTGPHEQVSLLAVDRFVQ